MSSTGGRISWWTTHTLPVTRQLGLCILQMRSLALDQGSFRILALCLIHITRSSMPVSFIIHVLSVSLFMLSAVYPRTLRKPDP